MKYYLRIKIGVLLPEMKCTSCGMNLSGDDRFVRFKCPNCLKVEIFRCSRCKRLSVEYLCPNCGFKGP